MRKGYVNEIAKNIDQALLDYTTAIKIDPKSAFAYARRGQIYLDKGILTDAVDNATSALEIEPQNFDALLVRAKANIAQLDHAWAVRDLDNALTVKPGDATARYLRGEAYFYSEVATIEPCQKFGQPTADRSLWIIGGGKSAKCTEGPDIAGALSDLDEALRLDPTLASAFMTRGIAHMALGNREQGAKDWRASYKLNPNNKELVALMNRARIKP